MAEIPQTERALLESAVWEANQFKASIEYDRICRNFDYFKGGHLIERSLRGGYDFGDLGIITDVKDTRCSPRGLDGTVTSDTLWRAPAQKENEPWVKFTRRQLDQTNFTDLIVTERGSILYRNKPSRSVNGNLKADFESIWENPKNDSASKFVTYHINSLLGGTTAIIPWWDSEYDEVIYKGFPRKNFTCVFHNITGELRAFVFFGKKRNPTNKQDEAFYQVWTEKAVYELDQNGALVGGEDPKEHYCDKVPVCLFREPTHDLLSQFGTVTASDIVYANENLNILLSDLARIVSHQSFSLLVTTNIDGEIETGPGARIDATQTDPERPVTAEYKHPDAKIREIQEIVTHRIEQMIQIGRIPKAVVMPDKTAESGVHLMIQWFPIQKAFEEAKATYTDNERRLAETTALVLSRWRTKSETADVPDVDFEIDFDDTRVIPTDPTDLREQETHDLQHQMITPVDMMIRRNPDLNEEEAKAKYLENKALNEELGFEPSFGGDGRQKGQGLDGVLEELTEERGPNNG